MKKQMKFAEALEKMVNGELVTRVLWADPKVYGYIDERSGHLMIHQEGKRQDWILVDLDIMADDWIIV